MKIHELFLKKIDRYIEVVIKADDDNDLATELEEYAVTRDISKWLGHFASRYMDEPTANGVWISGFFGSGKSHLLKIFALLLGGKPLSNGSLPADLLLPKIEDEILQADLRRAATMPSRSILFNIDQKFDGIGGDHVSPVTEVFNKVFNEFRGYYGNQGYIANFECDLDGDGKLADWKAAWLAQTGTSWEDDREAIATVRKRAFNRVFAAFHGINENEKADHIAPIRDSFKLSIETFARGVKKYIDQQPAGFRLNFFVDEVGAFIGQDAKRMLNLQTVAETLATICAGRAWVFVTSQADLEGVLGESRNNMTDDMSKIVARFKTQIPLASADVMQIIQKRLLEKKEPEPAALTTIYDREKENFQTLFQFGDNSLPLKTWRGSDEFCELYPFHPYQFNLVQRAIIRFSEHNIFTGKHQSVGERSLIAIFQEVAKTLKNNEVGCLATFDLMYDGLAVTIKPHIQTAIKMAEPLFGNGLEVRILKCLFLLKWVREFKATVRNIALLLIDRPGIDIRAHESAVRTALNALESHSYLQRTGDFFEFLTDTEKDIENEIKTTEVEDSEVLKLLGDILFTDVLRDPKIRYDSNQHDFTYARKLDDQLLKHDAEVAINIITTDHTLHGNPTMLAAQTTAKAELLVILPADDRLTIQARLFLKTAKFIRQNLDGTDPTRAAILVQRTAQNSVRRDELQRLAAELLGKAPLYINATRLDQIAEGDARNRILKACQDLISFAFPKLRMLTGTYDNAALSQALLASADLLAGTPVELAEAEQEILTDVTRNQNNGERTNVEEIAKVFSKRPYGWPNTAVLVLIARLFRKGKVELRTTELLDARSALEALTNSRALSGVRVRLQERFDTEAINRLKRFHSDFFDCDNPGTDARSVGQATAVAFGGEAQELARLLGERQYPFVNSLRSVYEKIKLLAEADYTYLIKEAGNFAAELVTAKENLIFPIKAFINGTQRPAYDEVLRFLLEQEANFSGLPPADLQPLLDLRDAEAPFHGTIVPAAKHAMTTLRAKLATQLQDTRAQALARLGQYETMLRGSPDFTVLNPKQQHQVLQATEACRREIEAAQFMPVIRDRLQQYTDTAYNSQLVLANQLANPNPDHAVNFVNVASLALNCKLTYLATPEDLDTWLAALRQACLSEINKGSRVRF